jgi:hypothetical protein
VSQPPVQLDHHVILQINAVPLPTAAARAGERHLPDRLRQAMGPLHIAVITELQHRMIATIGGHDKFVQVRPPAQLRTLAHGLPQPRFIGQIPGQRAGHPAAG